MLAEVQLIRESDQSRGVDAVRILGALSQSRRVN
jgi:hypothetical protein